MRIGIVVLVNSLNERGFIQKLSTRLSLAIPSFVRNQIKLAFRLQRSIVSVWDTKLWCINVIWYTVNCLPINSYTLVGVWKVIFVVNQLIPECMLTTLVIVSNNNPFIFPFKPYIHSTLDCVLKMSTVETRQDGRFYYITLNRPTKKNAIDSDVNTLIWSTLLF